MKNVTLPAVLMPFVSSNQSGKFVFIDDFDGWGEKATNLPGVEFVSALEGNGLQSIATGERWVPQCCSVRVGNHLIVQARDYDWDTRKGDFKEIKLSELPLFKDFKVVILTNNESLQAFAPVCSSKMELALFLAAVEEETEKRNRDAGGYDYSWSRTASDMASLAIFLYRSNPNKEKSLLDGID